MDGWALQKWSKRHFLSFFGKNWTNHPRQNRCARGKLVGVEEDFFFKLKV